MKTAFAPTGVSGAIRTRAEDFFVDEVLGFEPEGEGEFFLIRVQKRGANTEWVIRSIARALKISRKSISHSGLKDRHAVTRQWLSVHWLQRDAPDWSSLANDEFEVIDAARHRRKLRIGTHRQNRFVIKVRDIRGLSDMLLERASLLSTNGVPNYFGPQRFGHGNLERAHAVLVDGARPRGRSERGFLLSVARSHLFNRWLAHRLEAGRWDRSMKGDYLMLDGSRSFFGPIEGTDDEQARLEQLDVHVAGPLAGREGGRAHWSENEAWLRESESQWLDALIQAGAKLERRASRLVPRDLSIDIGNDAVTIAFSLVRGAYATSVLEELLDWRDASGET